jgi:acetylcholinesterase
VSEDCLTINVLRPSGIPANAKLPVLTWVYGGGFANGFAANYNGSAIVAQSVLRGTPVIYVNFNYRVGPLGFPQGSEAAKAGALNLGLKDQLAALEWIQANIGAFGGDKSKVTVFGESAGAASISILMLRPSFKKLARAAVCPLFLTSMLFTDTNAQILESGSWATSITNYAATREANWELFVKALPACAAQSQSGSVKCLKSATLDAGALVAASSAAFGGANESFPFVPTLDGLHGVYPALGSISLATGIWSKIPFITGCNKDEGTAFINYPQYVTSTTAETWIRTNFTPSLIPFVGEQLLDYGVQGLLKLYPSDPAQGAPFGTGNQTFGFNPEVKRAAALGMSTIHFARFAESDTSTVSDLSFHSQRRFSQELAAAQGVQSFGYHFIDPQPLPAYLGGMPSPCHFSFEHSAHYMYAVTHGQEVNYVFGNCATKSPASQLLCLNMINYWVSFATSLTPNDGKGGSRPEWPQYARVSPVSHMSFPPDALH